MKKFLCVFSFVLLMGCSSDGNFKLSEGNTCDKTDFFYQTKNFDCIDRAIYDIETNKDPKYKHDNIQAAIGVLAGIFMNYPEKVDYTLAQDVSKYTKTAFIAALYKANLQDKANEYAAAVGMFNVLDYFRKNKVPIIKDVRSRYHGYENDLLIGVFFATGDKQYLLNILSRYKEADDDTVKDYIRMGLLYSKFGPKHAPKWRSHIPVIKNYFKKHNCKKNAGRCLEVVTLSSAFWALRSLSKNHDVIRQIFKDFFKNDKRLQIISLLEFNNFSNYLLESSLWAVDMKFEKKGTILLEKNVIVEIEELLRKYENFEDVSFENIVENLKKKSVMKENKIL